MDIQNTLHRKKTTFLFDITWKIDRIVGTCAYNKNCSKVANAQQYWNFSVTDGVDCKISRD